MAADEHSTASSFLGRGWSFPPEFSLEAGTVLMTADAEDIDRSLRIVFGTTAGERFLHPDFGLDLREIQFDPISVTLRTYLKDRIRTTLLIHEPRINVLELEVGSPAPENGVLEIVLTYEIRGTNSRFNFVYPFYQHDASEHRASLTG